MQPATLPFQVCSGPCASLLGRSSTSGGDRWGPAPWAWTVHSLTVWEAAAHMAIISAPEANLTTLDCRQKRHCPPLSSAEPGRSQHGDCNFDTLRTPAPQTARPQPSIVVSTRRAPGEPSAPSLGPPLSARRCRKASASAPGGPAAAQPDRRARGSPTPAVRLPSPGGEGRSGMTTAVPNVRLHLEQRRKPSCGDLDIVKVEAAHWAQPSSSRFSPRPQGG